MLVNHPEIYWHHLMMAHDCTFLLSSTTMRTTGRWLITLRCVTDQPGQATGEVSLDCMSQREPGGGSGAHGDVVRRGTDTTALTAPAASKPHAKNNTYFLSCCHNRSAVHPLRPLCAVLRYNSPGAKNLSTVLFFDSDCRMNEHSFKMDVPGRQR